jgi:hypothetical protein
MSMDVQGVSLSTTCSLNVHWVSLSPPTTAFLNAGMSDCPASSQSGTGMNKNSDARMLRYRTEIQEAGMPMPAALTSMPMPSYGMYRTAYAICRKRGMGPIFLNKGAMSMGIFQYIYSAE